MKRILILLCICSSVVGRAQERDLVRKGNELYQQKKSAEAADAYQKALQKQPLFTPGAFNLGNALVQQKKYDAARKVMTNATKATKDPIIQSGAQYNTGNTYMSEQQWQQAVDAYKQSLRRNPQDADAKYNLSYALSKLKKQQEDQKQDKQDKKDQKDNKDQQQQKDQQKDDKKNKRQQQPDEGEDQQQKRPQPQQSKISEQQADNLLKALQQDEKKVQDKMQHAKAVPIKMKKDW